MKDIPITSVAKAKIRKERHGEFEPFPTWASFPRLATRLREMEHVRLQLLLHFSRTDISYLQLHSIANTNIRDQIISLRANMFADCFKICAIYQDCFGTLLQEVADIRRRDAFKFHTDMRESSEKLLVIYNNLNDIMFPKKKETKGSKNNSRFIMEGPVQKYGPFTMDK